MQESKKIKIKFVAAILFFVFATTMLAMATFAWYIYNTSRNTTNVEMAAGAGVSLQISNSYHGSYGQAAVLDKFEGKLNPVSTDRILNGFQKVVGFTSSDATRSNLVASLFGASEHSDYYKTSLFLRTNGEPLNVYISNIGYVDDDAQNPISTAIRVGVVTYPSGENQLPQNEYIFAVNDEENPRGEYNTAKGVQGHVLDSRYQDGAGNTIEFTPYNSENFCFYDATTGSTALQPNSVALCQVAGNNGEYGQSVQIDIYIWLEGCDKDCTENLSNKTLQSVAITFAGLY